MNDVLFNKIAIKVEKEFMCGGLSSGLYFDYAKECTRQYIEAAQRQAKDMTPLESRPTSVLANGCNCGEGGSGVHTEWCNVTLRRAFSR